MTNDDIPQASGEEILAGVEAAKQALAKGSTDFRTLIAVTEGQYQYSWGIRGDNTPEHAKYLGYLDGKELYPDVKTISFEDYVKDLLTGNVTKVYGSKYDL